MMQQEGLTMYVRCCFLDWRQSGECRSKQVKHQFMHYMLHWCSNINRQPRHDKPSFWSLVDLTSATYSRHSHNSMPGLTKIKIKKERKQERKRVHVQDHLSGKNSGVPHQADSVALHPQLSFALGLPTGELHLSSPV